LSMGVRPEFIPINSLPDDFSWINSVILPINIPKERLPYPGDDQINGAMRVQKSAGNDER
jgi:hypothetical protein